MIFSTFPGDWMVCHHTSLQAAVVAMTHFVEGCIWGHADWSSKLLASGDSKVFHAVLRAFSLLENGSR